MNIEDVIKRKPYYTAHPAAAITQLIESIKSRLSNLKTIDEDGMITYRGNLINYSVEITNSHITIFIS